MSMMSLTPEYLSEQVGGIVTELHVIIAKNSIVGMDAIAIAELLGVTVEEVQTIQTEQVYLDSRLILASEFARTQIDTDFNWDDIESTALKGLAKRLHLEKDTETLLKIAAVANKAQRRNQMAQNRVLDPALGGTRVPLTLTSRIVKRLQANGSQEIEETRQISVTDGTAINPKFEDIDAFLGVSRKPRIAENMKITTSEPDFGVDDLMFPG